MTATELPAYLCQVREVYAAITRKIEDLLFLLNEAKAGRDPHTRELSSRLTSFLASLERNVAQEKILAKTLPREKKKPFLVLLQAELQTIRELQAYVTLSSKKPTPLVITKINELHKAVEGEIKQQEALAAAA